MPAAVLVQFDDTAKARQFVERLNGGYEHVDPGTKPIRAVGVWRLPTAFCSCTAFSKHRGWTRGSKYGWMICSDCGRPSRYWVQHAARLWLALGRNLLPGTPDDGMPAPEATAGHDRVGALWYDPSVPKPPGKMRFV